MMASQSHETPTTRDEGEHVSEEKRGKGRNSDILSHASSLPLDFTLDAFPWSLLLPLGLANLLLS